MEQFLTWVFGQAPAITILIGIILGTFWKGWAVPGSIYRREAERADRLEALLLRSLEASEKATTVAERVSGK